MTTLFMGGETYKVSMKDLFCANRNKVVEHLRQAGAAATDGVVYLVGGPSETRYDSDHEPLFRQESYFWYLTGVKEPDCSVCMDVRTGKTTLFIPNLPPDYATIMGRIKTRDEWKAHYEVDHVEFTENAESYLEGLLLLGTDSDSAAAATANDNNDNNNNRKLLLLHGKNSDSDKFYEPPADMVNGKLSAAVDTVTLFPILAECRVVKSRAELGLLQHVSEVTSFAHAYTMRNMKPGMMEYQGESLFRHYCYYNYGCRLVGYTPICGCGPNAATLHYGHTGEPNDRLTQDTDIALFDMGAEYFGYSSDITCSFPICGKFSDKQRPIYQAVLNAQLAVYNLMKPGTSWRDCHLAADAEIIKALIQLDIVVQGDKTIEELVEMRLGAVFLPCGLGHFIGIDCHDGTLLG
jgi:Xaa-Pro dipeptidase